MERNTLDEAMQEAAVSADTANLTSAPENLTNDILPPINTDAKVTSRYYIAVLNTVSYVAWLCGVALDYFPFPKRLS